MTQSTRPFRERRAARQTTKKDVGRRRLRGSGPPATLQTAYGQVAGLTGNVVADPTGVMKTTLTFATVVPVFWALPTAPG
jgi:hypothetical protein